MPGYDRAFDDGHILKAVTRTERVHYHLGNCTEGPINRVGLSLSTIISRLILCREDILIN